MKRYLTPVLFSLAFASGAWAVPQQIYSIYGTVTNPPQEDVTIFVNYGSLLLNTVTVNSNFVYPVGDSAGLNSLPFSTKDTLYFTNTSSGVLAGTNGFNFETITETTIHSASVFVNDGVVTGFDYLPAPDSYSTTAGTTAIPAGSVPVASQVQVLATNILSDGTISVGNAGVLNLTGSNISIANGALVAGAVNTGGANFNPYDPLDTTGEGDRVAHFGSGGFYVNPPGVYDLYWGVTPTKTPLDLSTLSPPFTSGVYVQIRQGDGGEVGFGLPLSTNAIWSTNVFTHPIDQSNTMFNIVFVNTNFYDLNGQLDTNITATVGFPPITYTLIGGAGDSNGDIEPIVRFAMPVQDVITGDTVTNAVYLTDIGGIFDTLTDELNAAEADGFARPNAFVITTTTPDDWIDYFPADTNYDPNLIYEPNTYSSKTVTPVVASYGAQIGRNPAELSGSFNFVTSIDFFNSNGGSFDGLNLSYTGDEVILPDPTNDAARIQLTGNQVNLSNSRLRTEGIITINTSNLVGNVTGRDWGQIDAQLGVTNGNLVISNFFPTNFQRLRGNIYAYHLNWNNTVTNGFTNTYHYHLLVVDQNLGGNFRSVIRNLALTGTNSVQVIDSLYVINQFAFNTTNLTINSNAVFTQNAGNWMPTNTPYLQNLLVNTNASIAVDNLIDIGFDATKTPTTPTGRKYKVASVTNLGTMSANSILLQSATFENDGSIDTGTNGSMLIEAASIGLGLDLTNSAPNVLQADNNITLSAVTMGLSNSLIFAGGSNGNGLGNLLLQTTPQGQITDFASGAPATNTYTTNIWQVTDGFSLPVKPATGDLYGTEIVTIATNFTVALHTWAGVDWSNSLQGWSDNMVIGHLKLSHQSPGAELHFTGATSTSHYGMYVDYLELDTNNLGESTNYRSGILIDSNLTIYFAAANVDPIKLESAYTNRLVWVPTFWGPNSTVSVPYTNCSGMTNYCLMNVNLAFSPVIGFFTNNVNGDLVPNAFNQPFVLNDPNGNCADVATNFTSCGGDMTTFRDFTLLTAANTAVNVDISTVGKGTLSPNLKQSQVALGRKITLTATPATGWEFGGWTARGLADDVDISKRVLKFTVQNDIMLTATFVPKTFTLVQGAYYGLFMPTNGTASPATSGWFTMTVTEQGVCSGRLLMGPDTYSFSSKLATNGTSAFATVDAYHGKQTVSVSLNLDLSGTNGQVTGYVGIAAVQLLGNLAPTWTSKEPSPFASQYTMTLTNENSNSLAIGDSYGALTVSKEGVLSVAGQLADGNAFSQSVPISEDGMWPFYAYVSQGQDFLLGWVSFASSPDHGPCAGTDEYCLEQRREFQGPLLPGGLHESLQSDRFRLCILTRERAGSDAGESRGCFKRGRTRRATNLLA